MRKLVKFFIPKGLFGTIEPYGHWLEAFMWQASAGFPARKMKIIGVTGTNGKTTTCFLIHKMLTEAGYNAGLMTTVAYGAGGDIRQQNYHMTNVPVPELVRRLKWMRAQKVDWLVLETTSHALAQNRVAFIPYCLAVMTNVTHEHLDFHKTFTNYVNAKRRLFQITNANKKGYQTGIINAEDPSADKFANDIARPLTYGIKKGDVQACNVKLAPSGSSYEVKTDRETYKIRCQLPGEFNVFNCLAAVCAGRVIGLNKEQIEKGIVSLDGVSGRMTRVEVGQPFTVLVDYAHTPDALEKVLSAAKGVSRGKVAIVFGAAGDRDKSRRPEMGKVVARLADRIYLTDDETYSEDPLVIRAAVFEGIKRAGSEKKTRLVDDRKDAIELAFKEAKAGDVVLLTGIGHQDSRIMAGKKEPWNETQIATDLLIALRHKKW